MSPVVLNDGGGDMGKHKTSLEKSEVSPLVLARRTEMLTSLRSRQELHDAQQKVLSLFALSHVPR